ncbi:TPA: pathogenicity island protein [Staphylococcus aureus]|uniref:pathogenicity island protein n=1 Tax=Staphylococcus aureus TaxID=1280 RepID=UPI000F42156D|nr:pathogenicity island protein [Staphylococcus aureus]MDG6601556.1 pathogenicity island protein [Staphylococcus aureus]RNH88313.1 pathogenicity island protein [Staphylococcus aureus]HDZ3322676.1 pathogenicity island protein [Staphylococcus aureus]HDZ3325226.1 pathogenicity island protein [Staphylococcus aureus]HDZ3352181.1 pathogenicity island protein [Staphylococcus aureus]
MEIKQKYQLSKVAQILEVVLYEKSKLYDDISYRNEDAAFYEHALKLVHNGLFNVLAELDFEDEAFLILDEVTMTLGDVMKEKQDVYRYSVIDDKGEHKHTTDRKGHVIGMLEWALDYIVGNIEVEEL